MRPCGELAGSDYLDIRESQRRLVLAAVDLDFALGGLALTFDAPLAGRRPACLALEDAEASLQLRQKFRLIRCWKRCWRAGRP